MKWGPLLVTWCEWKLFDCCNCPCLWTNVCDYVSLPASTFKLHSRKHFSSQSSHRCIAHWQQWRHVMTKMSFMSGNKLDESEPCLQQAVPSADLRNSSIMSLDFNDASLVNLMDASDVSNIVSRSGLTNPSGSALVAIGTRIMRSCRYLQQLQQHRHNVIFQKAGSAGKMQPMVTFTAMQIHHVLAQVRKWNRTVL